MSMMMWRLRRRATTGAVVAVASTYSTAAAGDAIDAIVSEQDGFFRDTHSHHLYRVSFGKRFLVGSGRL